MTSYVINNRMTFECVDQDPEVINGMQTEDNKKPFFLKVYDYYCYHIKAKILCVMTYSSHMEDEGLSPL